MSITPHSFGQRLEVSVALRKLIRDYPGDVGILKELIQNADDGGAREILLFLDPRDQSGVSAPIPRMEMLGGPAIIAANDKPFSSDDLENIQRLADSEKIEAAGKTGRFGLGFNSVYNITDFPLLLTGENLCLFDPCAAIVEPGQSGDIWNLNDDILATTQFLDLFTPGGFIRKTNNHPGTIFRFPLRNQAHLKHARGKISDQVLSPEFFDTLVAGLAEIADSLLLFLKNLEFIGCYRFDPETSKRIPLLEIETLNSEEVQAGRAKVNKVLEGSVGDALQLIEQAPGGKIPTSFLHEVAVTEGQNLPRSMKWRVTTGLYAGDEGRLVAQARALLHHREKAIPSAGVAICLESSTVKFPPVKGQVCCFLPLGSKPGTFPVQLHGAFDLDSSRTDLTPHSAGEDERKRLRGQWNDLLVEDGLAEAYRQALELVREQDLKESDQDGGAVAFYTVFPRSADVIDGPLAKLSGAVFAKTALLPLFRCADGDWYPPTKLIRPPDNNAMLEACLVAEGFRVPRPRIPDGVVEGLGENAPPTLQVSDVREHFLTEEDIGLPLHEVPYPGLRVREQLEALVRFLMNAEDFDDWQGLPLAFCSDGKLHTFGIGDPDVKFSATDRQRAIFTGFSEWFLEDRFVQSSLLSSRPITVKERMTATHVAELVNRVVGSPASENDDDPIWKPNGSALPNCQWLVKVLAELNSAPDQERPSREITDCAYLIPGNDGRLHRPGQYQTPLLVKSPQKALCPILEKVRVLHLQLKDDPLSMELERFASIYESLWNLTPKNLADSLTAESETLIENQETWMSDEVVMALLRFLSSVEGLEEIRIDKDLVKSLRELPLFKDQTGAFSTIDDSCFLPGDFYSPEVELPIRLLQEDGWRGLLELLGVKSLDQRTLLRDYILPFYDSKDKADQRTLLKWIRDEWSHILNECEDEEERRELCELLEETPLVRTTKNSLLPIPKIYDPEHEELVRSVLGDEAPFPDSSFYAEQKDIWLRFFRSFQIARKPRPKDLAAFISGLSCTASERNLTGSEAGKIDLFLAHVTEHWDSLRDQNVVYTNGLEVSFAAFLSSLAWCPPIRDLKRLKDFGASVAPQEKLFKPSEIFLPEQGNLVATQAPLLKRGKLSPPAQMREDLGFPDLPDLDVVSAHLQELVKPYGTRELSEEEDKVVKSPVKLILRFFGELDEETASAETDSIFEILGTLACVYHPGRRRFYRPCDLFRSAVKCLEPWKIAFVPTGTMRASIETALDRLGRSDRPGISDHIDTLRCVTANAALGAPLKESDVQKFLDIQFSLSSLLPGNLGLHGCLVLDRQGCVAQPDEVLHLDDAWLESNMEPGVNLRLLHQNTPEPLIEELGIARVSRLLKRVVACALEESQIVLFAGECKRLEAVIKNEAFRMGFSRIATRDHGIGGMDIKLPLEIELKPVVKLLCANQVEFNGYIFDLAETDEDSCVDLKGDDMCVIWLAESAWVDLPDRLALALNELLTAEQQIDRGDFAAILRCPPHEISRQLDRRRIPRIAQTDFDLEKVSGPSGEIEFEETSEEPIGQEQNSESAELGGGSVEPNNVSDSGIEDEPKDSGEDSDVSAEDEKDEDDTDTDADEEMPTPWPGASCGASRGSYNKGERRGPMYPSTDQAGGGKPQPPTPPKRQDDLWISRPKTEKQFVQEQRNGDACDDEVQINHKVGNAAVGWVLQYERREGRRPTNMAQANAGYDVESMRGRIIERYIEVKGINGEWGKNGVPVSAIQFEKGRELGDQFWLYVVEHALDPEQVFIHAIQNPLEKISQFRFDCGWSECGEPVSFRPLEPKIGMKIFLESEGEGEILDVDQQGSTWHLRASFGGNDSYKNIIYNPLYMQIMEPKV